MDNKNSKAYIELLAPAGSLGSLIAAVNAGADAVYIGGSKFGARAYADNPSEDELIKGIEYAHHFGVRVYITINTLLKNEEMAELYDYILPYYKAGVDAAIVQDIGVYTFLQKHLPELNLHASTQMTVTGELSARWLKKTGATRVVPARELSLSEIENIHRSCSIEIECFVHGAMCYSYSGQCLMSSLLGGRSGNRGRCAQPCRLEYSLYDTKNNKLNKSSECTLLSCKDMCSLDILPDIIEAGACSLKIEGRMKSPVYTAGVVSIWRKYIDLYKKCGREGYRVEPPDRAKLLKLFDRGGQTDGYYKRHNGPDMMALKRKPEFRITDNALTEEIKNKYIDKKGCIAIRGLAIIKKDKPIALRLSAEICFDRARNILRQVEAKTSLDTPQEAKSRALTIDDVKKQLNKTGDSLYKFSELNIELDDGLFVSVSRLNELRRGAIEVLELKALGMYKREAKDSLEDASNNDSHVSDASREDENKTIKLNVICSSYNQLEASLSSDEVDEIGLELSLLDDARLSDFTKKIKGSGKRLYIYMPHIFRTKAAEEFKKKQDIISRLRPYGYIARNTEELFYLKGLGVTNITADYSLYTMNSLARSEAVRLGAKRLTLPLELNMYELSSLIKNDNYKNELIVYGRLPMMVSAQCLKKNISGCDKREGFLMLEDRKGERISVYNSCSYCYNTIFNAKPLSLIGISEEIIKRINPNAVRVYLTTEDKAQSTAVIKAAARAYKQGIKTADVTEDYTRGHIKRGVM